MCPLVVRINNEVFARHGIRQTNAEEYRRLFRFPVQDYYRDMGVSNADVSCHRRTNGPAAIMKIFPVRPSPPTPPKPPAAFMTQVCGR